jgi:hypothetical protein
MTQEESRTFRVGMFTNLTEHEAKTKYMKSYTDDFYGKPDPLGNIIFGEMYKGIMMFLVSLSIFLFLIYVGYGYFLLPLIFVGLILTVNIIILLYRVYKYPLIVL